MCLKACDLYDLIEAKQREHFQGSRQWLLDEVREWVKGPKRLFWLVGGAGTGKSVVSAQLLLTEGVQEHVKAWHFCRHDNAAGNSVRAILQSLAAILTVMLPSFQVEDVAKALSASSVDEMFELLIAAPLKRITQIHDGQAQQKAGQSVQTPALPPCVIVLDAVDELPPECLDDVLQLITDKFGELPAFVRLFITVSRLWVCGGRGSWCHYRLLPRPPACFIIIFFLFCFS